MELLLFEELLMLGLDDSTGDIIPPAAAALPFGIAGAIIYELFVRNKIKFENDIIILNDSSTCNDAILDEVIELFKQNPKSETVKYWVRNLNSEITNLIEKIEDQLVSKGILKKEKKKIFWFIPVEKYPTKDAIPEAGIRIHIRAVVLENAEPDSQMLAILSLIKATNLIDELFLKDEKKQAYNIITEYTENDKLGKLVSDVVSEITTIIASSVAGSVAAASIAGGIY